MRLRSNTVDAQKEEGRLHIPKGGLWIWIWFHYLLQAIEPRAQKSLLFWLTIHLGSLEFSTKKDSDFLASFPGVLSGQLYAVLFLRKQ